MKFCINRIKNALLSNDLPLLTLELREACLELERKKNENKKIGFFFNNLYGVFYCREVLESTIRMNLLDWMRQTSDSFGLSHEWLLLQERLLLEHYMEKIIFALQNNMTCVKDDIICFDTLIGMLCPLHEQNVAFILMRVSEMIRFKNFGENENMGMLLDVMRNYKMSFEIDKTSYLFFIKTVEDEFPNFSSYSVCYNALEVFVDCLLPTETEIVIRKLYSRTQGTPRRIILDSFGWLTA